MEDEVIRMPLDNNKKPVKLKQEHLPSSSEDGETHGKTNTDVGPSIGTDAVEHVFPSCILAKEARLRESSSKIKVAHYFVFLLLLKSITNYINYNY